MELGLINYHTQNPVYLFRLYVIIEPTCRLLGFVLIRFMPFKNENEEKLYQAKYREKHKLKAHKYASKYYLQNRDKIIARSRQFVKTLSTQRRIDIKYLAITLYRSMKGRVSGLTNSSITYIGLPICTRKEFYELALSSQQLKDVLKRWQDSNYDTRYSPTVDRIINGDGYIISNIQFLSRTDNCKKRHTDNNGLVPYHKNGKVFYRPGYVYQKH
jgi:hypothetical protein